MFRDLFTMGQQQTATSWYLLLSSASGTTFQNNINDKNDNSSLIRRMRILSHTVIVRWIR